MNDVDVQVLKGVVYISLADNMLYKSGSYEIGDRAGETLSKIAKIITDMSYCQIGRDLGNRDHSTVIHSCDQVSRRMSVDRTFRHEVEELESVLKKK